MPFAYYGAKHGLARKYPRPRYPLIIEPFAGAAGYSCHWATSAHHVVLADLDPAVVRLWQRVQQMDGQRLDRLTAQVTSGEATHDPLILGSGGSVSLRRALSGEGSPMAVTPRMRTDWPQVRRRIEGSLPLIRRWDIGVSDYRDLVDVEATWFIDPPYQPNVAYRSDSGGGDGYRYSAEALDYDELADWCRSRRGQVIVCEQSPAAWLPFTPIARQANTGNGGSVTVRTEVVWFNDQQQLDLFRDV